MHEALAAHLLPPRVAATRAAVRVNAAKILGDIPDYHTTPVQAAQRANAAHVNTLVRYHLVPAPRRNALMARMFVRGVDDVRPGTLLGEDGMLVTLPVRTKTVAVSRID